MTNKIKIIQWNIRSINSNYENMINIAESFNPDIILLSETFLKPIQKLTLKHYKTVRQDRDDGKGGLAALIRNTIDFQNFEIKNDILPERTQGMIIKITNLTIIHIYNPPDLKLNNHKLSSFLNQINGAFILTGDLNSQSPMWGSGIINYNGKIMEKILEETNTILLNDGTPTRFTKPGINKSAPDITICSSNLSNKCNWEVIYDPGISDHFPIKITIGIETKFSNLHFRSTRQYKTNNINWQNFSDSIDSFLGNNTIESITEFEHMMETCAKENIPIVKISENNRYRTIWWDDELTDLTKNKRETFRRYTEHPSRENYIKANEIRAKVKRKIKKKKFETFQKFCEELTFKDSKRTWRIINKFKNKSISTETIKQPSQEVLIKLMEKLAPTNRVNIPSTRNNLLTPLFSREELNLAINAKKDTAPGMNGLTYPIYKNLPDQAKHRLVNIINSLLDKPETLQEHLKILIIPFIKPGGNINDVNSIRPIALAPCFIKIIETLIKNRIEKKIEMAIDTDTLMYGFRRGRSIYDSLIYMVSRIYNSFARGQLTIVVFLDIKSAYDNIDVGLLLEDLYEINIPTKLIEIIKMLLLNRQLFIKDIKEGKILGPWITSQGVLQGSITSASFFNLYVRRMSDCAEYGVDMGQYADDTYLMITGNDVSVMREKIQQTLDQLQIWLKKRNLTLSTNKSTAMIFTKKHSPIIPCFKINNEPIQWKQEIKYLGVTLDKNLSWTKHTEIMCSKALKGVNILRSLCRTWWGAHPKTLLIIYKSLIRPYLDFGSIIYGGCSRKILNKLDTVQHQALRAVGSFMKSTPINILMAECGETSLETRRKSLAQKFICKSFRFENNTVLTEIENIAFFRGYWNNKYTPAFIKAYYLVKTKSRWIYGSSHLPFFELNYIDHAHKVNCHISEIQKYSKTAPADFNNLKNQEYIGYDHIYTDASVNLETKSVGIGIYSDSLNIEYSANLPGHWSIFSAEMMAICKAINIIIKKKRKFCVIFSDSLSAITCLREWKMSSNTNIISINVKKYLHKAALLDLYIVCVWIPSHSGIIGNERADILAKKGASEKNKTSKYRGDQNDVRNILQRSLENQWIKEWNEVGVSKGKTYTHMRNRDKKFTPIRKCFLFDSEFDKYSVSTMMRLRSNHCLSPEHLFKIKVYDSPNCQCAEYGDIVHILFNCQLNRVNCDILYYKLTQLGMECPISVNDVVFSQSIKIIECLTSFLKASGLKL